MHHKHPHLTECLARFGLTPTATFDEFARTAGQELARHPVGSLERIALETCKHDLLTAYTVECTLPIVPAETEGTTDNAIGAKMTFLERLRFRANATATFVTRDASNYLRQHICVICQLSGNAGIDGLYGCTEGRLVAFPFTEEVRVLGGVGGRFNAIPRAAIARISENLRARIGARVSAARCWRYAAGKWTEPKWVALALPGAYLGAATTRIPLIDSWGPRAFAVINLSDPSKCDVFAGIGVNTKRGELLATEIESWLTGLALPAGLWISGEAMVMVRRAISLG